MIFDKRGSGRLKILLLFFLCFLSTTLQVSAQEDLIEKQDFWICPGAEIAMYSISGIAYGGGLSIGYGRRAAVGLKADFFLDGEKEVTTLELDFLLRWYFRSGASFSGPFIQLNAGPAIFFRENNNVNPSHLGIISGGLSLGWRFLLGRYWFIEAAIRGGYPYIAGAGLYAGFHF